MPRTKKKSSSNKKSVNDNGATKQDTPPSWITSEARQIVAQCFIDEILPLDKDELLALDSKDIFDSLFSDLPEFAPFPYRKDLYDNRIESMRDQVAKRIGWANYDRMALENDRKKHPETKYNAKGEPVWKGSEADYWLRVDMEEGKHLSMKPRQLRELRPCYQVFTKERFRKRIDQIKQSKKEYGTTPGQNKSKLGNKEKSFLKKQDSDLSDEE